MNLSRRPYFPTNEMLNNLVTIETRKGNRFYYKFQQNKQGGTGNSKVPSQILLSPWCAGESFD